MGFCLLSVGLMQEHMIRCSSCITLCFTVEINQALCLFTLELFDISYSLSVKVLSQRFQFIKTSPVASASAFYWSPGR